MGDLVPHPRSQQPAPASPGGDDARPWSARPVGRRQLRDLHALLNLGGVWIGGGLTRTVFLASDPAKARLFGLLDPAARRRIAPAPVIAVVGFDCALAEDLIDLFPDPPGLEPTPAEAGRLARCAAVLQGDYLAVAARQLGLHAEACGGFDGLCVARAFFPEVRLTACAVVGLGHVRTRRRARR